MNILVFNCGSSSLKYQLIDMPSGEEICWGEAQRIGPPTAEPSRIVHNVSGDKQIHTIEMRNHKVAFEQVMNCIRSDSVLEPDAIGHRLVHGGTLFKTHTIVDDSVIAGLRSIQGLAPLHNPPAIELVEYCKEKDGGLPQVVVFDTAFHSTIPERAYTYALPRDLSREMGIRKFGFHGTSHQYVAEEAAKLLGKPMNELNAVSCHLGSGGASLCAIEKGCSIDNTMGYSPLQGLIMSTRCGDLDPAATLHLMANYLGDFQEVEEILNKRSGVLGMSGFSADIRDILQELNDPQIDRSKQVDLAAQVYLWRIRKYLGSYMGLVQDLDAVIFTDTIGETVPYVRWATCTGLECFGIKIDPQKNKEAARLPADIAADDSPVRIFAIKTNEEIAISRITYSLVQSARDLN
ncbi:MAG: acetate/propionate family kinase [Candidatus Omnitrophica bacterium]|nr:acetate/propionate family kinase [Candidatus Omnitrophota bacterium]